MLKEICSHEGQIKRVTQFSSTGLRYTEEVHQNDYSNEMKDLLFALKEEGQTVITKKYIEVEDDFISDSTHNEEKTLREIEDLPN